MSRVRKRVLITGSNGNLGEKLARHLLETGLYDLYLIDQQEESKVKHTDATPHVEYIQADLSKIAASWTRKLRRIEYVFNFAGCMLNADHSWSDAGSSLDVVCNVLVQAAQANVKRVIVASTWHVIGSTKDSGVVSLDSGAANKLLDTEPASAGCQWFAGGHLVDSTSYAVPKLAEERLAKCLAESNPTTSFIVLRIGWCQPGENAPSTISQSGFSSGKTPEGFSLSEYGTGQPLDDSKYLIEWFRNTWLSNRDFCSLCVRCVDARLPTSSKGFFIFNATSANSGSRWDLEKAKTLLSYQPQDDVAKG